MGERDSKGGGSERKRENYATLRNVSQLKNAKRREPTNTGWEPGLKVTGSGSFKPLVPPRFVRRPEESGKDSPFRFSLTEQGNRNP